MDEAYSETNMAWKLVCCIQWAQWQIVYRLGSELLSDAFRLALRNLLFPAQKTNYPRKIRRPFCGVMRQRQAEYFLQTDRIIEIQVWH